jgi:hypothetical protein
MTVTEWERGRWQKFLHVLLRNVKHTDDYSEKFGDVSLLFVTHSQVHYVVVKLDYPSCIEPCDNICFATFSTSKYFSWCPLLSISIAKQLKGCQPLTYTMSATGYRGSVR